MLPLKMREGRGNLSVRTITDRDLGFGVQGDTESTGISYSQSLGFRKFKFTLTSTNPQTLATFPLDSSDPDEQLSKQPVLDSMPTAYRVLF